MERKRDRKKENENLLDFFPPITKNSWKAECVCACECDCEGWCVYEESELFINYRRQTSWESRLDPCQLDSSGPSDVRGSLLVSKRWFAPLQDHPLKLNQK